MTGFPLSLALLARLPSALASNKMMFFFFYSQVAFYSCIKIENEIPLYKIKASIRKKKKYGNSQSRSKWIPIFIFIHRDTHLFFIWIDMFL
uniref:Putative ovule protein n=1 Tax=Solanum chacoense TaxID=4108 RepID=A0A0V0GIZ2_SOLCH